MSHSPTPWKICEHTAQRTSIYSDGHSHPVCTIDIEEGDIGGDEAEANARLIAEAPMLLHHLLDLVAAAEMDDENTPGTDLYDVIQAAKDSLRRAMGGECLACRGLGMRVRHPEGMPFSQSLASVETCEACGGTGTKKGE